MGKITYKIDRITSNSGVEFGLKTGATITGSSTALTIAKPMIYEGTIGASDSENTLVNKKYITSAIAGEQSTIYALLRGNYLTAGNNITLSKSTGTSDPAVTISLATASDRPTSNVYGVATATDGAYKEKTNANISSSSDAAKQVVTGIKTDDYGRIIGIYTKQVSTSDLNITGAVDNYVQWNLQIGSATASSSNVITIGSGNTAATAQNPIKGFGTGSGQSDIVSLQYLAGDGMSITANTTNKQVTFATNILANGGLGFNNEGKLYIPDQTGLTAVSTPALYNISFNSKGLITGATAASMATITGQLTAHSADADGIVKAKVAGNTASSKAATTTYFYGSDAKWYQINWDHLAVATAASSTSYKILGAATGDSTTTAVKCDNITIKGDGTLSATKFSGNGSSLTNLNASNISSGQISKAYLPQADIIDWIVPNDMSANRLVLSSGANSIVDLANPTGTQGDNWVLTSQIASGGSGGTPSWKNINDLVKNVVSGEGGMVFQGLLKTAKSGITAGTTDSDGYIRDLPATGYNEGWFYRVAETGNYSINGTSTHLEVGDAVYCLKTWQTGITGTIWGVLQSNIDRAIVAGTGNATATGVVAIKTSGADAIYDGFAYSYENSKYKLTADISGNAGTATKLATARTLWGVSFDGSANISGGMTGVNSIAPTSGQAGNIGASDNKYGSVYATTFYGALSGNASSADKVNKKLTISNGGDSNNGTYDGSAAKTIDLGCAALGYLTDVDVAISNSGSGNAIVGLSDATVTSSTGVAKLTATLGYLVSDVTSSVFSHSTATGTSTIGWLSTATAGTFYTGTTFDSSKTGRLNLGATLYAQDLHVYRGGDKYVATMIDNVGTANTILVNDDSQGGTGKSGFKSSGVSIVTAVGTPNNDNTIATAKAVKSYVDAQVKTVSDSGVHVAKATFSGQSTTASASIPANAIIEHVDIYVTTKYTATAAALDVKIGSTTIIANSENDITSDSDAIFTYKFGKSFSTSAATCSLTLTSADTTGAGAVYVYYNTL